MIRIAVGAAVVNQTPLDWSGNLRRLRTVVSEARARGVSLLCLPEMCLTGYGCEDAFHAPDTAIRAWSGLQCLTAETVGMVVCAGVPIRYRNALYNCAALMVDGRIAGLVAKRHLAGDGIHYEPRWFKPWPADIRAALTAGDQTLPLGDIHFDIGGVRIGFEICEDAWVAQRPGAELARQGVDVILNPSASHFAFGKHEVRRRFVTEGSRAFSVSYLYANLLGNEAGRVIYDGGALIASGGKLLAEGARFGFSDHDLSCATIDVDTTRTAQVRSASFEPDVEDRQDCVVVPFCWPDAVRIPHRPAPAWESGDAVKEEEFARAVALGLRDYQRKSRASGFVVSLSGGADSSACAVLSALAHRLDGQRTPPPLLGVYQRTAQSSETTEASARAIAAGVGAEFHVIDVQSVVDAYGALGESVLGRKLTWADDDVALQNIQARVRAPTVWLLANVRNALLLTTSNRSEAAVGYATMDGDTCGGLAPLAGIDKLYLRRWLRWMETTGPEGVGPWPALAVVNKLQPSAELRPAAAAQTDEADLMPFDVLDAIERAAIRDKQSPADVLATLSENLPQYSISDCLLWIERFYSLWCRNQWKRERYAPSFHLDDADLDPRSWCRFPILSAGYREELAEMRRGR